MDFDIKAVFGVAIAAVALPFASQAVSADDAFLTCATEGCDRYADGRTVADGECYALVYTKPGFTFAGFSADGTVAKPEESDLVAVAPLAKDGHCPRTLFAVPRDYASSRKDGKWEIFLLDTRGTDGKPAGLDAKGVVGRIRRWGEPAASVRDFSGGTATSASKTDPEAAGGLAANPAELPKDAPRPRITGIKVENGVVKVTVADTVPYLAYGLDDAETAKGSARNPRAKERAKRDGDKTKEIVLESPAAETEGGELLKVVGGL